MRPLVGGQWPGLLELGPGAGLRAGVPDDGVGIGRLATAARRVAAPMGNSPRAGPLDEPGNLRRLPALLPRLEQIEEAGADCHHVSGSFGRVPARSEPDQRQLHISRLSHGLYRAQGQPGSWKADALTAPRSCRLDSSSLHSIGTRRFVRASSCPDSCLRSPPAVDCQDRLDSPDTVDAVCSTLTLAETSCDPCVRASAADSW